MAYFAIKHSYLCNKTNYCLQVRLLWSWQRYSGRRQHIIIISCNLFLKSFYNDHFFSIYLCQFPASKNVQIIGDISSHRHILTTMCLIPYNKINMLIWSITYRNDIKFLFFCIVHQTLHTIMTFGTICYHLVNKLLFVWGVVIFRTTIFLYCFQISILDRNSNCSMFCLVWERVIRVQALWFTCCNLGWNEKARKLLITKYKMKPQWFLGCRIVWKTNISL